VRAIVSLLVLTAACRGAPTASPVSVVDFIKEATWAERRPPTYSVENSTAGGTTLAAIAGPVPGRLTWTLPMPRGARFRARVAAMDAPVGIRIGISDERVYERLFDTTITPGADWTAIDVDLGEYAGWKLSLFYRPDAVRWRLVLSADAIGGVPARIAWGTPEIVAGRTDVLEYNARRVRLTRSGAP